MVDAIDNQHFIFKTLDINKMDKVFYKLSLGKDKLALEIKYDFYLVPSLARGFSALAPTIYS